ncbi:hypothetical protein [Candidatus Tisiphia endosymbiont of Mystacides longicornis]|uniref:hypothetical protein n=1 Tax=Candidatus Tisiphia endosymbiont of Mystacides longicornis TaxID=3139330 RepID=UPI003CCAAC27
MQIPSITIEQVAQQFKAWRQTKTNKFDPIPNHLKELVHQLLHHYSYQEIAIVNQIELGDKECRNSFR